MLLSQLAKLPFYPTNYLQVCGDRKILIAGTSVLRSFGNKMLTKYYETNKLTADRSTAASDGHFKSLSQHYKCGNDLANVELLRQGEAEAKRGRHCWESRHITTAFQMPTPPV